MKDTSTFDLFEGRQRKDAGMQLAADSRRALLERAKEVASRIAQERGEVTSDDVFHRLADEGLEPTLLGNAAGCVFRGKEFEFTGRWKKSARVSNHASDLRVWQLRGKQEGAA